MQNSKPHFTIQWTYAFQNYLPIYDFTIKHLNRHSTLVCGLLYREDSRVVDLSIKAHQLLNNSWSAGYRIAYE